MPSQELDVFVSYHRADRDWAEWIAWTLEDADYAVKVQAWDIRPGHNFVLEMQDAASRARHTLAVLSPSFLDSEFTQSEWAAAFARDPRGKKRTLIPIRVEPCDVESLLAPIVYADLVGLDEQEAARVLLGAFKDRAKPDRRPDFPKRGLSVRAASERPDFPGRARGR